MLKTPVKQLLTYFFTCFISLSVYGAPTAQISLLHNNSLLTYSEPVRLLSVLQDAYNNTNFQPYALGISLIVPHKQPIIEQKKIEIFEALDDLNSPESLNIKQQLKQLDFRYRETIETNITKVQELKIHNPLLEGEYQLFLPPRPKNILLINSQYKKSTPIPIKPNFSLRDYLLQNNNLKKQNSVWIIQADQNAYLASNVLWKNTAYFLSPGAIIYRPLQHLPKRHSNLNEDIVSLLTFNLDL